MNPEVTLLVPALIIQLLASLRVVNTLPEDRTGGERRPVGPADAGLFSPGLARTLDRQAWLGQLTWTVYLAVAARTLVPGFGDPLELTPAFGPITQAIVVFGQQLVLMIPPWLPLLLSGVALLRARASVSAQLQVRREQHENYLKLGVGRGGGLTARAVQPPAGRRPGRP